MDAQRTRREWLKQGGGITLLALLVAAGWIRPGTAAAESWNKNAFDAHSLDDTLKALGGTTPTPSPNVVFFSTPDIAENGAVVPIGVTSNIPKTESIAILIENNPNMMVAVVGFPAGTASSVL